MMNQIPRKRKRSITILLASMLTVFWGMMIKAWQARVMLNQPPPRPRPRVRKFWTQITLRKQYVQRKNIKRMQKTRTLKIMQRSPWTRNNRIRIKQLRTMKSHVQTVIEDVEISEEGQGTRDFFPG